MFLRRFLEIYNILIRSGRKRRQMGIHAINSAKDFIFKFAHLIADFLEFPLGGDGKIIYGHAIIVLFTRVMSKSFS